MLNNRLKTKLSRGETANGVILQWPSPEIVEYLGHLGFDYVFIDAEHGYIGRERCADMCRAADASGIVPLVRVPENNAATILGYLECGAMGIIVPHVSTAEGAAAAAAAVRYAPLGHRGGGSSTRPANYGATQTSTEYFTRANETILLYVMIEDMEGVDNLDAILAVDGVDVVAFGPGDFALSMGYPGQSNHPEVQRIIGAAREKIRAVKPGVMRHTGAGELFGNGARAFLAGAAA